MRTSARILSQNCGVKHGKEYAPGMCSVRMRPKASFDPNLLSRPMHDTDSGGFYQIKRGPGTGEAAVAAGVTIELTKPLRIEYFRRHRDTLERVQWDEPRASASRAIEITIAMAKAKEQQLCDPDFVAAKA